MDTLASRAALRRWLDGDWGLYFSHPQDFARLDFEADRWLVLLEDAFGDAGVRPLGPEGARALGGSWIEAVGGAECRLPRPPRRAVRYVAAYDASLRLRRRFTYSGGGAAPSPLDIAAAISLQRRRESARRGRSLVVPATVAAALAALYFSRREASVQPQTAPHY